MTELIPDNSHRLAHRVGQVLHPYLIPIPTLLLVLNDYPPGEVLAWSLLVLVLVLLPGIGLAYVFERKGKPIYRRHNRGPIYGVGWVSVLVCVLVLLAFDAPRVLIASVGTLAVWLPVQMLVNAAFTKISTHMAVIAGCFVGIWYLDKVETIWLATVMVALIVLTGWARIVTKNHTPLQVVLGVVVGAGSVLVAFPLLLGT